jgi:hypothetical protein
VAERFEQPPLRDSLLGVDATGVGRPVVEMLEGTAIQAYVRPVIITAGHQAHEDPETRILHVPKKDLVSVLQVLLQARRITVAQDLPEAKTLTKELQNFRVKITLNANETYEAWRSGQRDDLVLAVAIAAWLAEQYGGQGTIGLGPSREQQLGINQPGQFGVEPEDAEQGILLFGDEPTPDREERDWWENL